MSNDQKTPYYLMGKKSNHLFNLEHKFSILIENLCSKLSNSLQIDSELTPHPFLTFKLYLTSIIIYNPFH